MKRLALTSQGVALESRLTGIQRELLTHAFDEVGEEGAEAWFRVMETMARRLGV